MTQALSLRESRKRANRLAKPGRGGTPGLERGRIAPVPPPMFVDFFLSLLHRKCGIDHVQRTTPRTTTRLRMHHIGSLVVSYTY